MSIRQVVKKVKGQPAVDGAGVHLVRVLGHQDVYDFDPFLMLDGFDTTDPDMYIKGFPMHPHRGIETITYLIKGRIEHEDSLGNKGVIGNRQCQWMTSGNGILHEEMPKPCDHMLGMQLWLNLPKKDKMTEPAYNDITEDMIGEVEDETSIVRVLSGSYKGATSGVSPTYVQATIYDVTVKPGKELIIDTKEEDNVFLFLIDGDLQVNEELISTKTAVLFGEGGQIRVKAPKEGSRFMYMSGKPLKETIAWAGPIVMNTKEELSEAFSELEYGTFIKH